ncbi:MAG: hypothetical protein J5682_04880 [Prevotella sp.]|nr:hypothetical protein [Prevotella sp.]
MNTKRLFTVAVTTILMTGATMAQTGWRSYSYIEAQGGLQLTTTNAPKDQLITPTAALSFGHYFSPVVGARLHINGWQSKSGFKATDQYYKWNYITPDLDLLINLSNIFGTNTNRALNLILLGGVGLNYAWDSDEFEAFKFPATTAPLAWKDNHLSHNIRAGLRLETNMSKPLGLSLEVNANSLDDRFNMKTNDQDDWMFTAMLGVSFRFGHKAPTKKGIILPVSRDVEEVIEEEVPEMVTMKEKRPVTMTEKVNLHKEIFYAIRMSNNEDPSVIMEQVAKFMADNPESKVYVVGYADKGTGNARLNEMYAKRRAETFKRDIVSRHNVDVDRIIIDSKGDTVQPFAENDKNRCVIIDAEGTRTFTDYEEVEVQKQVMKKIQRTVKRQVTE